MTAVRYFKSLAMALRQRKLSEDKVAEVLRELQSHLQEAGQSPEEAFGSPGSMRPDSRKGTPSPAEPRLPTFPLQ